jgi:hypothetical protein
MSKIILITIVLYLICEVLCHGFALFVRKIFTNVVVQDQRKPLHLQFVQQTFYRTMLVISILLMSHFYSEMVFIEQSDFIRFTWSITFIVFIVFTLWWLNALIIRQVLLQSSQNQSVTHVFKQKISYIMWHPLEFKEAYINADYLKKSVWLNRLLSLLALIILFLDVNALFTVVSA